MALPIAATPRYKLTIPSTGKTVTYRPFLVKEEKALMIAQQSEDADTMISTLKAVIESCIEDKIKSIINSKFHRVSYDHAIIVANENNKKIYYYLITIKIINNLLI